MSNISKYTEVYDNNSLTVPIEPQIILSSKGTVRLSHINNTFFTPKISKKPNNIIDINNKKTDVEEYCLKFNEKSMDKLNEINILKAKLEQYKSFYEEGKRSWLEDLQQLHKCIYLLKQHINQNFMDIQNWFHNVINQLNEVVHELDCALCDERLITNHISFDKDIKLINFIVSAKTKLSFLINEINTHQVSTFETKNEKVFQNLDSSIKSALLRVDKSIITKKFATEPSTRESYQTSSSSKYQYLVNDTVMYENTGNTISLYKNQSISISPSKLKTIIENNLTQSIHSKAQSTHKFNMHENNNANLHNISKTLIKQNDKKISLNIEKNVIKKPKATVHKSLIANSDPLINDISDRLYNSNLYSNINTNTNSNAKNEYSNKHNIIDFEEDSFAQKDIKKYNESINPFIDIDGLSSPSSTPIYYNDITNVINHHSIQINQNNSIFSQYVSPRFGEINNPKNNNNCDNNGDNDVNVNSSNNCSHSKSKTTEDYFSITNNMNNKIDNESKYSTNNNKNKQQQQSEEINVNDNNINSNASSKIIYDDSYFKCAKQSEKLNQQQKIANKNKCGCLKL